MRQDGQKRPDVFDAILRWLHRLLNPPAASRVPASSDRPRRVRDRVPI
jgi:hypothetical protein